MADDTGEHEKKKKKKKKTADHKEEHDSEDGTPVGSEVNADASDDKKTGKRRKASKTKESVEEEPDKPKRKGKQKGSIHAQDEEEKDAVTVDEAVTQEETDKDGDQSVVESVTVEETTTNEVAKEQILSVQATPSREIETVGIVDTDTGTERLAANGELSGQRSSQSQNLGTPPSPKPSENINPMPTLRTASDEVNNPMPTLRTASDEMNNPMPTLRTASDEMNNPMPTLRTASDEMNNPMPTLRTASDEMNNPMPTLGRASNETDNSIPSSRRPSVESKRSTKSSKKTSASKTVPEEREETTDTQNEIKESRGSKPVGTTVYQIEVRFIVYKAVRFCGGVRVMIHCQEETAYVQLITLMNEVFATYDLSTIHFLESRSAAGVCFCAVPSIYKEQQESNSNKSETGPQDEFEEYERNRRQRCRAKKHMEVSIDYVEVVFCVPEQMIRFKTVVDTVLCAIQCQEDENLDDTSDRPDSSAQTNLTMSNYSYGQAACSNSESFHPQPSTFQPQQSTLQPQQSTFQPQQSTFYPKQSTQHQWQPRPQSFLLTQPALFPQPQYYPAQSGFGPETPLRPQSEFGPEPPLRSQSYFGSETPLRPQSGFGPEPPLRPQSCFGPETPLRPQSGFGPETPLRPQSCFGPETPLRPQSGFGPEQPLRPQSCFGSETPLRPQSEFGPEPLLRPQSYFVSETPLRPQSGFGPEPPLRPQSCFGPETPLRPQSGFGSEPPLHPQSEFGPETPLRPQSRVGPEETPIFQVQSSPERPQAFPCQNNFSPPSAANGCLPSKGVMHAQANPGIAANSILKKCVLSRTFDPCPRGPGMNSAVCLPCDLGDPYELDPGEGRVIFCTPACLKVSLLMYQNTIYQGKLKIVQGSGGIGFIIRIENVEGDCLYSHSLRRDLVLYDTNEVEFGFSYNTVVCHNGRTTLETFVVAFPSCYQKDQFQHAVATCNEIMGMTSVHCLINNSNV